MNLRRLETTDLVTPTEGTLTIAVARHLTASWPHPDLLLLHRRRASLIHTLVDELSLEVKDWGATDAEHPSEIVELLLAIAPTVLPAVADIIAGWITKPAQAPSENEGLLGIKLKRPDGAELTVSYRDDLPQKQIATMIESFLLKLDEDRS